MPVAWQGSFYPPYPTVSGNYERRAAAGMVLETGGKGLSRRQNLFCLSAGAGVVKNRYAGAVDDNDGNAYIDSATTPVTPTDIEIDGKALGSDGKLWRAYGDNQTIDVTPKVKNQDFYTFTEGMQKYELNISANGIDLSTNTPEFCVGQKVTFAGAWDFDPGAASTSYSWALAGTFVNRSSQADSQSSVNWDIDPDSLSSPDPFAYWIDGGNKNAYLHETLHFSNGQSATVSASGQFNMFKPKAVMVDPYYHGTPTVIWETLPWYNLGAAIQLGVQGTANNMSYVVRVTSSDFAGDAKITQICNINATGLGGSCSGCLDGSDPYNGLGSGSECSVHVNKTANPTGYLNEMNLDDAPDAKAETMPSGVSIAQMNDSFIDYVMFNPDPVGDGIYVTLDKVTWDVSASVTSMSTNITQSVHGPTMTDSDEFPTWSTTR